MAAALVIGVPVGLFGVCVAVVAARELGRRVLEHVVAWIWRELFWGS